MNATLGGIFDCHTIFQGYEMSEEGDSMVKTSNLKTFTHCWFPTNLISSKALYICGIKHTPTQIQCFLLPILHWATKPDVPMNPPMRETHDLRHRSLPCPTNTIQLWKYIFKRTIPTPYILPKLHISTITHVIPKKFRKR